MDVQGGDILKQILARLDKMDNHQHKLDRVIERLDTLQNITESQNQKQNLLDKMLIEMPARPREETAIEKQQGAQQETIEPFQVVDNQEESALIPHKTKQALQGFVNQIEEKLKSLEDRAVDTAQTCHQLTSWSHKMEAKMTELAVNSVEMKTFLVEMRSVKDLIKGQTNSELIWLNNNIDKKLSDIGLLVTDIHQIQTEMIQGTVASKEQFLKTDMQHGKLQGNINKSTSSKLQLSTEGCDTQMQEIPDLKRSIDQLKSSVLDVSTELKISLDTIMTTNNQTKQYVIDLENTLGSSLSKINESNKEQSETQTSRIISAGETAKEELKRWISTDETSTSKYQEELGTLHSLIESILASIQGQMKTVGKKIDTTKSAMLSTHQTIKKQLKEPPTETAVNDKLEEINRDLKDYICRTKREIFAVTEKEAQIVRHRILGPLPSPGKYTLDFDLNEFSTLVRSGDSVDSLPWHINQLQTCVTGSVTMSENGDMEVWLLYGRHPREVGLQLMPSKTIKVKATIRDINLKKLPPLDVGETTWFVKEGNISSNGHHGCQVGVVLCDELLEKGYGDKEEYDNRALLIRYEVTF